MSKLLTAINVIIHNKKDFLKVFYESIRHTTFLHYLSDISFIKITYRIYFHRKINLSNPISFNEKLNWLKLNFRQPIMKQLVDKIEVKHYVAQKIGKEYIIPTLSSWDNYESIDLTTLPNKFVLKGAHDSSSVVICNDKSTFNLSKYSDRLRKSLKSDLYNWGREWPYKGIKKRIMAEVLLEDPSGLRDYKFFCFNGKVKCFKIDFDRHTNHKANYYDSNALLLSIGESVCPPDHREFTMPSNLNKMITLAEILAEGFPFVRVDFYNVKGKIYFGEMTFFPAAGFGPFTSYDDDILLGSWLQLPQKTIKHEI